MTENAQLQCLSFHLDETGKRVIAAYAPEGATDNATLDGLKQAVTAAGFGAYKLNEAALRDATTKYAAGKAFEIAVAEAVDGKFDIHIDADQVNACLSCTLPLGGVPVRLENILDEAINKQITLTLDLKAVEQALTKGGDDILIASGRAPVAGLDGKFENLIPSAKERSPRLDEHGLADFRELGGVLAVHAGDRLMRRIPPTDGEPGLGVSGQAIPAKPGKNIAFAKKLEGTAFDPADANLLLAATDGRPVLLKDGVLVEAIYTVKEVDLRSGNIDFPGTVNVTEGVHAGMTVKAAGDIHVNGTVEGGILIAGGDIVVKGGIIGLAGRSTGKKSHPSSITCGGSCSANFVQNAQISAGSGIFIRDTAMQSELSAGHQIIVGDKGSRKGHLIGGVAQAAMLVRAKVIGSPARAKTIVIAGPDKGLHDRLTAIAQARDAATNKLISVIKLLEVAHANPGRLPAETVKSAETTRDAINAEMIALSLDEDELKREIAHSEKAQVVAEQQFLEGAELRFGAKRHNVVADREGGVFQLQEGELVSV